MKGLKFGMLTIIMVLVLASCRKEEEIYDGVALYHEGGATVSIYEMDGKDYHLLSGHIVGDFLMSSDKEWVLDEDVNVENGGHLTIQPGTKIYGSIIGVSYIAVQQGGKITANGTEESPIVLTSFNSLKQTEEAGDWGGIIINGFAPVDSHIEECVLKRNTGVFGGENAADNSGSIRNVIIEYAGKTGNTKCKANALSLYGVGSGTIIENVTTRYGHLDGIEQIGGTVDLTNASEN